MLQRLYVRWVLFKFTKAMGGLWLRFYRWIYPDFAVGKDPAIWGRFNVMMFPGGAISIGSRLHMISDDTRSATTLFSRVNLTVFPNARIIIGDRVALNGTTITSKKRIEIGDGAMIAQNVIIVDSDFHAQWPPETRHSSNTDAFDRAVSVGRNVWIGMNTIILKGVTVGDNSIIGAGSVVVKDIPANVLAAGNPARVIRALGPVAA